MAGTQREHGVHGSRPSEVVLRCVLLGPPDLTTPADLHRSLEARGSSVTRVDDEYTALATLIEFERASEPQTPQTRKSAIALLMLEPERHAHRCEELYRAAQLYTPRAVIWQYCPSQTPSLSAYLPPKDPEALSEAEQIEQVRRETRAAETPYEQAVRSSAPPSLRLVIDDDHQPHTEAAEDSEEESDGLLSSDEIEMLMDPLFETKPRRGGDQR